MLDWKSLTVGSPLLAALPGPARRVARLFEIPLHASVFSQGDRPKAMFFVLAGEVRLVVAEGRVTAWLRPVGIDLHIHHGAGARYEFQPSRRDRMYVGAGRHRASTCAASVGFGCCSSRLAHPRRSLRCTRVGSLLGE